MTNAIGASIAQDNSMYLSSNTMYVFQQNYQRAEERILIKVCSAIILLITIVSGSSSAAEAPIILCNQMTVELASVSLANESAAFGLPSALSPGECKPINVPAGSYNLEFIERGNTQAAICHNQVEVSAGKKLNITPDDGATCMM